MIKTVLIDLDDTIFDFHGAEAKALGKTLEELGVPVSDETIATYSEINAEWWRQLELGKATRDEVLTGRFEVLFQKLGINASGAKARELYEYNLGNEHGFIPGAEEVLIELYQKYDLYLASNGTDSVQTRRIAGAGIAKYFKDIFISQRIGYDKPSVKYFDACFARIKDFKKSETIIIGDSLTSDIRGGINAGILTCRYNPKSKPGDPETVPDYEIKNLSELPERLAKI